MDAPASVLSRKKRRVKLLRTIAFVRFNSIPMTFGPPSGSEEAQAPYPSKEMVSLDVVPLDTQSGGGGENRLLD